jgi:DNA replication protein DnaC
MSISDTITVDTARLPLLLRELRLPTIAAMWQTFTERADREAWPAARLLATLTELELAERYQRRIQRHLIEAHLPHGKTLDSFDFAAVPMGCRVACRGAGHRRWMDRQGRHDPVVRPIRFRQVAPQCRIRSCPYRKRLPRPVHPND